MGYLVGAVFSLPFTVSGPVTGILYLLSGAAIAFAVRPRITLSLPDIGAALILLGGIISFSFSSYPAEAGRGLLILVLAVSAYLLGRSVQARCRLGEVEVVVFAAAAFQVGVCAAQWLNGVHQVAGWQDHSMLEGEALTRVYGFTPYENPNFLGAFLLIPAVLAAQGFFRSGLRRGVYLVLCLAFVSALLLTGSRSALLGFMAGLGFLLFLHFRNTITSIRLPAYLPIAALGCLALVLLFYRELLPVRFTVFTEPFQDSSLRFRLTVWREVLFRLPISELLLGIGPGSQTFQLHFVRFSETFLAPHSSYNLFVEFLLWSGVIGFSGLCALLSWIFYQNIDRGLPYLSGCIVALTVQACFDGTLFRPALLFGFFLLAGLEVSYLARKSRTRERN